MQFCTLKENTSLTITGGLTDSQIASSSIWNNVANSAVIQGNYYNGVQISTANGIVVTRNDNKTRSIQDAVGGFAIQKYSSGLWSNVFSADTNGDLQIKGNLLAGSIISNTSIQGGTISIGSGFGVNSSGVLTASGANIQGIINCSDLRIGGTSILYNYLIDGYYVLGSTISNLNASNMTTGTLSANRIDVNGLKAQYLVDPSNQSNRMYYHSGEIVVNNGSNWFSLDILGSTFSMGVNDSIFLQRSGKTTTLYGTTVFPSGSTVDFTGVNTVGLTAKFG